MGGLIPGVNPWKAITGDGSVAETGRSIDRNARHFFRKVDRELFYWLRKPDVPETPNPLLERRGSNNKARIIYGQQRVGLDLIFLGSSGDKNKFLHYVGVIGHGEIESIDEVWLDDIKASDPRYGGKVYIAKDPSISRTRYGWVGTSTQAAPADLVADLSDWSSTDQGRGLAYIYLRFTDDEIFGGNRPEVLVDVRGLRIYDPRSSTTYYTGNNALVWRDYMTNTVYGRGLSSSDINDTLVGNAADNCDTMMDARTNNPAGYQVNQTDHINGDYTVTLDRGGSVAGNAIYPGDSFTVGSSDTTRYLVINVAGTNPDYTITYTPAARTTFADNTSLDFQIPYFSVGGVVDAERSVFNNVKTICNSFRAYMPYYDGVYNLYLRGFDDTATYTITDDVMIGAVSFNKGGKEFKRNKITAKFGNPSKRWNIDVVIQESATYLSEDNGLLLEDTVDFQLENDPFRALYRAETILKESRDDISFQMTGPLELLQLRIGEIVNITYDTAGWVSQSFRVMALTIGVTGLISCEFQEYSSSAYDRTIPAGTPTEPDTNIPVKFDTNIGRSDIELVASNWLERTNPKNIALAGVTFGNGQFVAVGDADGTDAYIITSSDGIKWVEQSNPKNFNLYGIIYAGGQFVAVGQADGTDAYIITSSDGITWTERANPKNFDLYDITYAGGQFVAVGQADGTDTYIITSSDGITWTERANPKNLTLSGVTFGNGIFVAVGGTDLTDAYIVTSSDGITWTERSNPGNADLYGITYGHGQFIAVGASSVPDVLYMVYSDDGITWTEISNPVTGSFLLNIIYADGLFIVIGGWTSTDSILYTSTDGSIWDERRTPVNDYLYDIAYSDTLRNFVIVGQDAGTGGIILTSLFGK